MSEDTANETPENMDNRLFLSLGEQLRQTLLYVSRGTEQIANAESEEAAKQIAKQINDLSESASFLIEAYVLNGRLRDGVILPEVMPVAVSSLLNDALHELTPIAKQYGVQLELDDMARMAPVLGDPRILHAALVSLGQVFVFAAGENELPTTVRFSAHRSRYGIVAGVYTKNIDLTKDAFRLARGFYGEMSQPFSQLVSGAATGVFVADSLLEFLATKLHVAHYHRLTGLATTLPYCDQLQLVEL